MTKKKISAANADETELNLTGLINALDLEESLAKASAPGGESSFDPNATMDYRQAGMPYPELPFAQEEALLADGAGSPDSGQTAGTLPSQSPKGNLLDEMISNVPPTNATAAKPRASRSRSASGAAENPESKAPEKPRTRRAPGAASGAGAPGKTARSGSSTSVAAKAPRNTPGVPAPAARDTRSTLSPSASGMAPLSASNYRPVNIKRPTYRIRGGGKAHSLASRFPVVILATTLFICVGVCLMYYLTDSLKSSISLGPGGTEFGITQAQTRQMLDSRLPILVNLVDYTIEDTAASLTEAGQFVYTNARYQPDSLDTGAVSSELVSMPQEMSDSLMQGYYEGSYNAYSPEELTQYFNGAYVLDMARGEYGSWNKLKYVNFNTTGIHDEMAHLAELQGLSGETVTVSAQGLDSRGNRVIQGQKVVDGDRILYFKIAACLFKDVYGVKSLTDASVFITCTVATYDFYAGTEAITPE